MRRIYADNAATTPLDPAVREAMEPWLDCANPSSQHAEGRRARMAIDEARERVAARLKCLPGEVVFTSSGTEAANLAIIGACWASQQGPRRKVLFGASEHHCVLHTKPLLEAMGFQVGLIACERDARVASENVLLDDGVFMACVMHANNETGVINDVEVIGDKCRSNGTLFFSDCVQTLSTPANCDFRSYAGHKVYGPKGVGALVVKAGTKPQPLMVGGGQEREVRAGTEDVAAIVGFATAVELSVDVAMIRAVRDEFVDGVDEHDIGVAWTPRAKSLPGHAHFRVPGITAESLLIVLDRLGVAASSGAACSSGSIEPSHVLLAAGHSEQEAAEGIRFSFGKDSTVQDATEAVDRLARAVSVVRGLD